MLLKLVCRVFNSRVFLYLLRFCALFDKFHLQSQPTEYAGDMQPSRVSWLIRTLTERKRERERVRERVRESERERERA